MKITIWHNNVCSTSRKALSHLENLGYDICIRPYLTDAPSEDELEEVLKKLGEEAPFILRKKDKVFQEKFSNTELSNEEWIKAMHNNPSIIERPIVISDKKAWLARPFEQWAGDFNESI
jgi:arsenate reductase